jgi:hypothetical protein
VAGLHPSPWSPLLAVLISSFDGILPWMLLKITRGEANLRVRLAIVSWLARQIRNINMIVLDRMNFYQSSSDG